MDWSKGAQGPQYAIAAANTEMAGRQLGILLMVMITLGMSPSSIHLIGFSLGAHVAGCASEWVKSNDHLIGRITGLDPAGPLFRHHHLREKSKKLDKSDAQLVDVVHTDGSPLFIDGFGLWEAIGHVDYFANGGEQQPGCQDLPVSIVHSTFDRTLNKDSACSHLRAFQLFLESVQNKATGASCQFVAYKCPAGLTSFVKAQCFPQVEDTATNPLALDIQYYTDVGRMGIDPIGEGVMYFGTRDAPNFCGSQLQMIVVISGHTARTSGHLFITLHSEQSTSKVQLEIDIHDEKTMTIYSLFTIEFNGLKGRNTVKATMRYQRNNNNETIPIGDNIFMEKMTIRDIYAHSWHMCSKIEINESNITKKLQRNALC